MVNEFIWLLIALGTLRLRRSHAREHRPHLLGSLLNALHPGRPGFARWIARWKSTCARRGVSDRRDPRPRATPDLAAGVASSRAQMEGLGILSGLSGSELLVAGFPSNSGLPARIGFQRTFSPTQRKWFFTTTFLLASGSSKANRLVQNRVPSSPAKATAKG